VSKETGMEKGIKVLIVDDSAFARSAIAARLGTDSVIEVVGQAKDGLDAIEKTKELKPDVVTLDVVMPRMDGLAALERIMHECPTPVVMLSALTGKGADATIKALELGAVDFFLKPSIASPVGRDESTEELVRKIRVASQVKVSTRRRDTRPRQPVAASAKRARRQANDFNKVVVIGSSTGGPQALNQLIPAIPGDIPALVLIVQHMPSGFTKSLADRLDQLSHLDVREARSGDQVGPGMVFLAPGGYHMRVTTKGEIQLDQGATECGVRPSVNVTMESAARVYGASVLGVVLTGMGSDGTRGATLIKGAGGKVIVQDEATCAVYGMPASVVEAGKADKELPLPYIADEIVQICRERTARPRQRAKARV
jgi:two-component system chemotaxis response regulator CheB